MKDWKTRTRLLLGASSLEKLNAARVAVFGVGGVGGFVVEGLARGGIGHFVLVDSDKVELTNLNRQIIALRSTLGEYKVDAAANRILDINPEAEVERRACFFLPENADSFDFASFDYVVDAVDTVTAKLEIITRAKAAGVRVISAMGAGNKLDPTRFEVADIYDTEMDPLAKVMRRELRKRGVKELKVVYSKETALQPMKEEEEGDSGRRSTPGSLSFVPSVSGLIIAGEVIKDLIR